MIFVDEARIFVKAGDGGKGCDSYYREKYMRHPRPDGGNGGRGANVQFIADRTVQTLLDFRFQQHYKGAKGGNASSKNKSGRTGKDTVLRVPIGTIIKDHTTGLLIKDLTQDRQTVIVAKGGEGGLGNIVRKVPTAPKPGEELTIHLELKLIADVGLVGFPNAGKSTIISNISRVKSKIANYPFTTKKPILGFVEIDEETSFVVADLPGIIEGAHKGKGLGHQFLKHAERTKVLVHVIDMSGADGRDPLDDYEQIKHELEEYSEELTFKHSLLVANKMDVEGAEENLKRFHEKYEQSIVSVSALDGDGLNTMVEEIQKLLCLVNSQDE